MEDININPSNPRYIRDERYQKLKKSLQEFPKMMKLRPIIVDDKGMILGGNMRYLAMVDLGYEEIPEGWVVKASELTEEEQRKFKIIDNIPFGDWDYDILANEWDLEELQEWGIEFPELESVTESEEDDFDIDKAVEEVGEPVSKNGDIWRLGEHRLMCGDSRKKEDVERLMDEKEADMVFTDPPYNALKSWKKDEAKSECRLDPSKWFRNDNMEWNDYKRLLLNSFSNFTGYSIYICCDFRVYPLITEAIIKSGWDLKHCIIWVKNVWGLGKRYRFQHEFIVYASKKDAPFFGDRSQSDVWNIDVDRSDKHNTPKPIALCSKAINNSSKTNHIVADFFGGSGSTLIACEQLNRRCYMMEIDPIYCDVVIKRWENYTKKKAVKVDK